MQALELKEKMPAKRKKEIKNILVGYSFIFPVMIGLVVFTAVPFFYSLYLAFTDFNGLPVPTG